MKFEYSPKNNLEKFGTEVFSALVENFSQTFFVGGMVRDLLLNIPIHDIDIATEATPEEILNQLKKHNISYSDTYKKFGNISAVKDTSQIEITTFRKDVTGESRYPEVIFTKSLKQDAKRRDFTINSLYLSPKLNKIFDYNRGLKSLNEQEIKFIGNPKIKIKQDPLRIIRALRFALTLGFKIEKKSLFAIKKYFDEVNKLTKTKLQKEIMKVKNKNSQKIILEVINNPKTLDKHFK